LLQQQQRQQQQLFANYNTNSQLPSTHPDWVNLSQGQPDGWQQQMSQSVNRSLTLNSQLPYRSNSELLLGQDYSGSIDALTRNFNRDVGLDDISENVSKTYPMFNTMQRTKPTNFELSTNTTIGQESLNYMDNGATLNFPPRNISGDFRSATLPRNMTVGEEFCQRTLFDPDMHTILVRPSLQNYSDEIQSGNSSSLKLLTPPHHMLHRDQSEPILRTVPNYSNTVVSHGDGSTVSQTASVSYLAGSSSESPNQRGHQSNSVIQDYKTTHVQSPAIIQPEMYTITRRVKSADASADMSGGPSSTFGQREQFATAKPIPGSTADRQLGIQGMTGLYGQSSENFVSSERTRNGQSYTVYTGDGQYCELDRLHQPRNQPEIFDSCE